MIWPNMLPSGLKNCLMLRPCTKLKNDVRLLHVNSHQRPIHHLQSTIGTRNTPAVSAAQPLLRRTAPCNTDSSLILSPSSSCIHPNLPKSNLSTKHRPSCGTSPAQPTLPTHPAPLGLDRPLLRVPPPTTTQSNRKLRSLFPNSCSLNQHRDMNSCSRRFHHIHLHRHSK